LTRTQVNIVAVADLIQKTAQMTLYMPMEFILNKKVMCVPHVSSIFKKKSALNIWTALCVCMYM
jgi:hypothetical protein